MVTLTVSLNEIPKGGYLLVPMNSEFIAPDFVEKTASKFFPRAYKSMTAGLRRHLVSKYSNRPLLVPDPNGGLAFFYDNGENLPELINRMFICGADQVVVSTIDINGSKESVLEAIFNLNVAGKKGNIIICYLESMTPNPGI